MKETRNTISDEAVVKATGRTWNEWFTLLDSEGARNMEHKDIARMLRDKEYIRNGWWCQEVTVAYELARGMRVVGETKTAGFEIGVQKTLDIPSGRLWDFLTSPSGLGILLGTPLRLELVPGEEYLTENGAKGQIRSVAPGEKLRFTWQPAGRDSATTVQLYLVPSGEKTSIRFHQEQLAGEDEREQMRSHWRAVSDTISKALNEIGAS